MKILLVIVYFAYGQLDSQYVEQICSLQIFDHFSGQVNGKRDPQSPEAAKKLTVDISGAEPMDSAIFRQMPDVVQMRQQPGDTLLIAEVITAEYPGKFSLYTGS